MSRRWWVVLAIVVFCGVEAFQLWQLRGMRKDLTELKWSVAVQGHDNDNVITPEVGTIQFLKRGGYSIQLNAAKYTGEGLHLEGYIGNPTNLWLSNLSLKFSATKDLYDYKDDFTKNEFSFFFGPQAVGEAQCSPISTLIPGGRQPFDVTIPNVKQTKDGIRLTVAFIGESDIRTRREDAGALSLECPGLRTRWGDPMAAVLF